MKRVNFLGLYAARKYEPCYVRGPRNLERFRYLRNHISVRFVLMNINTGDSRGLFFSFSALYPPRSIVRGPSYNKVDLRFRSQEPLSHWRTPSGVEDRERESSLCTHLREVDFQCAATGVYVCSVKCLLRPRCRFHRVERGSRGVG